MIWNCLGSRSLRAISLLGHHVFAGTHVSFPAHILRGVGAPQSAGSVPLDAQMDQLFVLGGKTALSVVMPRLQQLMQTKNEWKNRQIVQQA